MANIITGIDIGSHKVSVVIAMVDEDSKARVIGEASYPSVGIRKGEITGIDEAINSIASALNGAERMAGLTVSSAYVSINGKQIISNNNKGVVAIADSEITEDDVFRTMEQARTVAIPPAREIIHLIPREFIVDQQSGIKVPIGMTGNRLEVDAHIISSPVTAIHNLEKCIQSTGLKIDSIVFTGWAAAQSVLTPTEKELGVLLLDIGGGTVSITTFVEDAVTYSTSIPLGGSNITRDLAAGLRLSLDDAEKVKVTANDLLKESEEVKKIKPVEKKEKKEKSEDLEDESSEKRSDIINVAHLGIEGVKTISRKLFSEIVDARVEEILELVKLNIEQSGNEYKLPAGIVLTGGAAQIPGITAIAKKVFGAPARVGIPRGLDGLVEGISSSAYSVVSGLLLYALHDEVTRGDTKYTPKGGIKSKTQGGSIFDRLLGVIRRVLP